jgi:nucleotide-binding universal stress UspA family protein
MFEKILLCTDFSEYATKISECLPGLPGIREIILLHVFDATHYHIQGWTYNPQIENAKIRLEEQKKHFESYGLQVKVRLDVITAGDIAGTIRSAADEESVSLIVIGSRGGNLLERTLLGRVAGAVLRSTSHPVLVLNHNVIEDRDGVRFETVCPEILSKVIFPTDFSQPSDTALDVLKGMKGIGTLVLVHVITQGQTAEEIKILKGKTQQKLDTITEDLASTGITALSHVRFGNPVEEILRCAKEEEASLIYLCHHAEGWLHTLLKGERSIEIVMQAKRPVLVVWVNHDLS